MLLTSQLTRDLLRIKFADISKYSSGLEVGFMDWIID
jgi:hypothetical protein